ncbi:MAG: hypothetical protein PHX83_10835 [Acidobacteriia bacterium]|nr:hypothetical protein [Terriglobia bacterium]
MMRRRVFLLLGTLGLLLGSASLCKDRPGIAPRRQVSDYSVTAEVNGTHIGAMLLTSDQVSKLFASDLKRGYLVVEVGFFPKAGEPFSISRSQFTLRADGAYLRPAEAKDMAANLRRTNSSGRDVVVVPSVGIGYETGPRTYDPYYGNRGGLTTSTGVGVGIGSGGPKPSSPEDQKTMEQELNDKGLAEGLVSNPVAGYLYFPVSSKKKLSSCKLEWLVNGKSAVLNLQ